MKIEIIRASEGDATVLANLFQYYIYDMGDFVDCDVAGDGRFAMRSLEPYWKDDWRFSQLVRVDDQHAGFALVHQRSRITGDTETWDVAEFFILRRYRRHGVGTIVAHRIFDSFRGRWEVRELATNGPAIAFWRRVIAIYTKGNFTEAVFDDERWHGPVQSFTS